MPVHVLNDRWCSCPRYSLVGQFARDAKTIAHVALLGFDQRGETERRAVDVIHMSPLLLLGRDRAARAAEAVTEPVHLYGLMEPDLVAWIDLDEAELNEIDFWLHDLRERLPPRRLGDGRDHWDDFILDPCRAPAGAPARFSCAGLVYSAYADSGLDLPLVDLAEVPPIAFDDFVRVWGVFATQNFDHARLGLAPHTSRRVLLPGHLFRAVQFHTRGAPPYRPRREDIAWSAPVRTPHTDSGPSRGWVTFAEVVAALWTPTLAAMRARVAAISARTRLRSSWTLAQVFTHLAQSVEFSVVGFPRMRHVLVQRTFGRAGLGYILARGAMRHDVEAPVPGAPPLDETDVERARARLLRAIDAFERAPGPLAPHFLYGPLSKTRYARLHALHIEDHLQSSRG